jgi:prevent-host-death family protein
MLREVIMASRIPAREARAHFAELTDRVRYTGEPVIIEKQGKPFVAVVPAEELEAFERFRMWERQTNFALHAIRAARIDENAEPIDDEIVKEFRAVRRELYRERYGGA